jgi:hypothetical protein
VARREGVEPPTPRFEACKLAPSAGVRGRTFLCADDRLRQRSDSADVRRCPGLCAGGAAPGLQSPRPRRRVDPWYRSRGEAGDLGGQQPASPGARLRQRTMIPAKQVLRRQLSLAFIIVPHLLFAGCGATNLSYVPQETLSVEAAVRVATQVLESQPAPFTPASVDVSADRLRVVRYVKAHEPFRPNFELLPKATVLYFNNLGGMDLNQKDDLYIARIWNAERRLLIHVYSHDRHALERLLDAVYVLSRNANPL